MKAYTDNENWLIDTIDEKTGLTSIYGQTFEQVKERRPNAELVTVDDWLELKAKKQDSPIEWQDTTKESYEYGLNCLPPRIWAGGAYLVGEPYDHHATTGEGRYQCYRKIGNIYLESSRPITVKEFQKILDY